MDGCGGMKDGGWMDSWMDGGMDGWHRGKIRSDESTGMAGAAQMTCKSLDCPRWSITIGRFQAESEWPGLHRGFSVCNQWGQMRMEAGDQRGSCCTLPGMKQ